MYNNANKKKDKSKFLRLNSSPVFLKYLLIFFSIEEIEIQYNKQVQLHLLEARLWSIEKCRISYLVERLSSFFNTSMFEACKRDLITEGF